VALACERTIDHSDQGLVVGGFMELKTTFSDIMTGLTQFFRSLKKKFAV